MSRARRRDRRVYWRSHPVLFVLLAAGRRRPVVRLGRTLLVHGADAYTAALTGLALDRTAAGTTGGGARRLALEGSVLFDEEGKEHREARRALAGAFGTAGVAGLSPAWQAVLDRRVESLAEGGTLDVVDLAVELAGTATAALLDVDADPRRLAGAARAVAAAAVREHLPGRSRAAATTAETRALAELTDLVGTDLAAMLAVASVTTTVAGLPRAVAWCADDGSWEQAADPRTRAALTGELLRVVAPTPVLPRVAAADGVLGGHAVRRGDRLVLVARHAAGAHRHDPDAARPHPARVARLVFGVGPHACPGARLAAALLADTLAALAPYRPVVVRARADARSALPGWAVLTVRAGPVRR